MVNLCDIFILYLITNTFFALARLSSNLDKKGNIVDILIKILLTLSIITEEVHLSVVNSKTMERKESAEKAEGTLSVTTV